MKKFLAILLSVAMIMSMGIMAFANVEIDGVTYTDKEEVIIRKSYKLTNADTSSPAETFTLVQDGDGVVTAGNAEEAPALGTVTGATYVAGGATTAGAIEEIKVALPEYTSVGTYEYIVKEVAGTTAGVKYFDGQIKLVITVINDEETPGKLRIYGVHAEAIGETTKSDTFENVYSAGDLELTKKVTGNLGDKDQYFEFKVTLTGEEGKTYPASFAVTGGSTPVDHTNPTTIGLDTETSIWLKDGDTVKIENLPYGVTYSIVEVRDDTYDAPQYSIDEVLQQVHQDPENEESPMVDAASAAGEINDALDTVKVVNNKGTEIDTGVLLDSLPYVLIIAAVAAAGVFMIIKRRRAVEA